MHSLACAKIWYVQVKHCALGYERVYLPRREVADTPFYIQGQLREVADRSFHIQG